MKKNNKIIKSILLLLIGLLSTISVGFLQSSFAGERRKDIKSGNGKQIKFIFKKIGKTWWAIVEGKPNLRYPISYPYGANDPDGKLYDAYVKREYLDKKKKNSSRNKVRIRTGRNPKMIKLEKANNRIKKLFKSRIEINNSRITVVSVGSIKIIGETDQGDILYVVRNGNIYSFPPEIILMISDNGRALENIKQVEEGKLYNILLSDSIIDNRKLVMYSKHNEELIKKRIENQEERKKKAEKMNIMQKRAKESRVKERIKYLEKLKRKDKKAFLLELELSRQISEKEILNHFRSDVKKLKEKQ